MLKETYYDIETVDGTGWIIEKPEIMFKSPYLAPELYNWMNENMDDPSDEPLNEFYPHKCDIFSIGVIIL